MHATLTFSGPIDQIKDQIIAFASCFSGKQVLENTGNQALGAQLDALLDEVPIAIGHEGEDKVPSPGLSKSLVSGLKLELNEVSVRLGSLEQKVERLAGAGLSNVAEQPTTQAENKPARHKKKVAPPPNGDLQAKPATLGESHVMTQLPEAFKLLPKAQLARAEPVIVLDENGQLLEGVIERHFDGTDRYDVRAQSGAHMVILAERIRGRGMPQAEAEYDSATVSVSAGAEPDNPEPGSQPPPAMAVDVADEGGARLLTQAERAELVEAFRQQGITDARAIAMMQAHCSVSSSRELTMAMRDHLMTVLQAGAAKVPF